MRNCGRSTRPASPGNFFVVIRTSSRTAGTWSESPAGASRTKPRRTRSPSAGGCDFAPAVDTIHPRLALWTANALPSVITLTELPFEHAVPDPLIQPLPVGGSIAEDGGERLIELQGIEFRVHIDGHLPQRPAVLLPLDQFFTVRVAAAVRLWRVATGRQPGPNPGTLPKPRRDRLVLALRAIDGRADNASYREIATVLFDAIHMSRREWKSHDLRDRTIRLVQFGLGMMRSGYRGLLNYPFRRRL
jgi:hypothetical protein